MLQMVSADQSNRVAVTTAAVAVCAVQVPAYVMHRLPRVREAGSNQAECKRRARLLALLAALIRVSGLAEASDNRAAWLMPSMLIFAGRAWRCCPACIRL